MAKLIRIETKTGDNEKLVYNVPETAEKFAYDGCHKCYILENEEDLKDAATSYDRIKPLDELAATFMDSCPFRFVDDWSLQKQIVPQCSVYAKFVYDDGSCEVYDTNDYGEKEDEDDDEE